MKLWFFVHCLILKRVDFIWLKFNYILSSQDSNVLIIKKITLKMHILSNIIRFKLIKIAKKIPIPSFKRRKYIKLERGRLGGNKHDYRNIQQKG